MSKRHQSWFALGLSVSAIAAACGEDSTVDKATAQAAANELVGSVDNSVSGFQSSGDGTGAIKVKCAGGGEASVKGKVNVSKDPVKVDVAVAIDFQNCQSSDGTTMLGDVDVVQSVLAGKTPLHVQTKYSGNVMFSGKVKADCAVDIQVEVDEAGKAVNVEGSFCGQDAKGLDIHVSPRWRN